VFSAELVVNTEKKNLLLMYNLVNTVVPATRITRNHYQM